MKNLSKAFVNILIFLLCYTAITLTIGVFRESYPYPVIFGGTFSTRAIDYLKVDRNLIISIKNSMVIGTISTFIATFLSYFVARRISTNRKFKKLLMAVVFLPMVVSATSIGIGLQLIFIKLGMAGKISAIILVHIVYIIPYSVWIMIPGFESFDDDLYNQARILGASKLKAKVNSILVHMFSFIKTSIIMGFILSFSQYYLTLVLGIGLVNTFTLLSFPFMVVKDRSITAMMSIIFILLNVLFILAIELISKIIIRSKRWHI